MPNQFISELGLVMSGKSPLAIRAVVHSGKVTTLANFPLLRQKKLREELVQARWYREKGRAPYYLSSSEIRRVLEAAGVPVAAESRADVAEEQEVEEREEKEQTRVEHESSRFVPIDVGDPVPDDAEDVFEVGSEEIVHSAMDAVVPGASVAIDAFEALTSPSSKKHVEARVISRTIVKD